eukprot:TRINITY_DN4145_c0_g2_i1.p1 TRINITY_DN4145_c0_g2~~TRINITY_DN4145_c0_g2_i1.p1  ORF type:complete len:215 (-),score=73.09 TRINITY_DN4145_c0_g2_i1:149-766(-)
MSKRGGKYRKRFRRGNEGNESSTPSLKNDGYDYGKITVVRGNGKFTVQCDEEGEKLGNQRGNIRRQRLFKGDFVLVSKRDYQPAIVDIVKRYTPQDARWLWKNNHFQTLKLSEDHAEAAESTFAGNGIGFEIGSADRDSSAPKKKSTVSYSNIYDDIISDESFSDEYADKNVYEEPKTGSRLNNKGVDWGNEEESSDVSVDLDDL